MDKRIAQKLETYKYIDTAKESKKKGKDSAYCLQRGESQILADCPPQNLAGEGIFISRRKRLKKDPVTLPPHLMFHISFKGCNTKKISRFKKSSSEQDANLMLENVDYSND